MIYEGSALLPCVFTVLGVHRSHCQTLTHIPTPQRNFIDNVGRKSVKAFIDSCIGRIHVHQLALLEDQYSGCLDQLRRLCFRRCQFAGRYVPDQASRINTEIFELDAQAVQSASSNAVLLHRMTHRRDAGEEPAAAQNPQ